MSQLSYLQVTRLANQADLKQAYNTLSFNKPYDSQARVSWIRPAPKWDKWSNQIES